MVNIEHLMEIVNKPNFKLTLDRMEKRANRRAYYAEKLEEVMERMGWTMVEKKITYVKVTDFRSFTQKSPEEQWLTENISNKKGHRYRLGNPYKQTSRMVRYWFENKQDAIWFKMIT